MKFDLKKSIKLVKVCIYRYRVIIVWLVVLGLLGFTLWRLQAISNPQPDERYLEQQRNDEENQITDIQLNDDLREKIEILRPNPVDVDPENLGTQDPFNP